MLIKKDLLSEFYHNLNQKMNQDKHNFGSKSVLPIT